MIAIPNTSDTYFALDSGFIFSKPRPKTKGGVLESDKNNEYLAVTLCVNGEKFTRLVHILIATAYVPNPLNLPEVNHYDGIKHNNHPSNLIWCTRPENQKHRYDVLGHITPNRKLSKENVLEILSKPSVKRKVFAEKFGVTAGCIEKVKSGKNYKGYFDEFNKIAELNK